MHILSSNLFPNLAVHSFTGSMMYSQYKECIVWRTPPQNEGQFNDPCFKKETSWWSNNTQLKTCVCQFDHLLPKQNTFETTKQYAIPKDTKISIHFGIKFDPPPKWVQWSLEATVSERFNDSVSRRNDFPPSPTQNFMGIATFSSRKEGLIKGFLTTLVP